MKTILSITCAFVIVLSACEKPNQNPVIRGIDLDGQTVGARVNAGEAMQLNVLTDDDEGLARYDVRVFKGAILEENVVTTESDYNFSEGTNISGKSQALAINMPVSPLFSPGAYRVEVTITDDEGLKSVTKKQTFTITRPDNELTLDIIALRPGPPGANDNIIFTSAARAIDIEGRINSNAPIRRVKFFMASKDVRILEREFTFPDNESTSFNFDDVVEKTATDTVGTKFRPLIPSNVGFGSQLEFIITAEDANGQIASSAFGVAIGI